MPAGESLCDHAVIMQVKNLVAEIDVQTIEEEVALGARESLALKTADDNYEA